MGDKTSPKSSLRLEWVYGYRGHQCRNNVHYTLRKDVVYFVAGVGIVLNARESKQKFFLGHDDDIVSLALHPDRVHVATGQIGKEPKICVWDTESMQTVSILKPDHLHGVASLTFDKEGERLASVGMDGKSTIIIWDWKKGRAIATVIGHTDKVFDIRFNPYKANSLASVGVKHIKFWTLCGNDLTAKKGVFGKVGDIQTQLCVAFGPNDLTYSGTMGGDIYVWKGTTLDRVIEGHKGSVHTIDANEDGYATGAKDGTVRLWDTEFKPLTTVDLTEVTNGYKGLVVRAACWRGDTILAGTQDSEIFEITVRARDNPECLVQGHAEGELWALAIHPKKPIFVTGSDDHTLRLWSMNEREALNKTTLEAAIRSCAVNDDGSHVAVGLKDGSFIVLKTKDLSEVIHVKDRKEVIHEMKYSPDGKHLAVGSNDNFVDIYAVNQLYKKVGQCSGSSSFITHLDWSEDNKYLQTNSGARERLFYKTPGGKQLTNADEIREIRWASFTGVLGPEVNGIWAKYSDVTDVNAADANFGSECIVTGDDFGLVKLFRFPSLKKGAKFKKYTGHSAHVTNVRFSHDKRRVITTGGSDQAIFQWTFADDSTDGATIDNRVANVGAVDSDSEASDSDLSDVAELDSDIETEGQVSYDRGVEKGDMKQMKKLIKTEMTPGEKRNKPPNSGLRLSFVHGYRGYDCRNNLFYTPSGDVIYHVAAVGVVYQREKHAQNFYLEHTDDILCLCVNPMKDVAATGQVGRDPPIHIWDYNTMKTVSILKGQHQRGVCAVDFSGDGKKLASVGLDDDHTIIIWDWKKGESLATTRGHKGKIYVVKCNPFDPTKLVTVGDKHIKFWTQTGGGFTSSRGTFGTVAKLDTMMCVVYGKDTETCFTGGASGDIYVWAGTTLQKLVKAHEGPCFAMHSLDKGFVTGGKDGVVSLWDEPFERCLKQYAIKHTSLAPGSKGTLVEDSPSIRSVVLGHGHILVGTRNSEILEIDKSGPMNILAQGHQEKEVWGLCTHPSKLVCATVSDDKTMRIWSLGEDHKMVNCKILKKPGRCLHYSPDGKALAVGLNDGSFVVVNADTLEDMVSYHHRKEEISDIKFSPDQGKYLAVASHDNFVDIYNVLSSKRVGVCKGASSYITHIDWDQKGKLLMVNSGAKELLYFEAPRGKRQTITREEATKIKWGSWTGVLGQTCDGIWPPKSDVTDVNAADVTKDRQLIATGDDFGFVKLFNYPSMGKFAKFKKYSGHSAHVTNVRWTYNDELLVSVGGADTAVMVWRRIGMAERVVARGDSDDSDTGSEEEGGYDSDVQREKSIDYAAKTYTKSIRETEGIKPQLQQFVDEESPAVSRQVSAPAKVTVKQVADESKKKKSNKISSLTLSHVFGYRGFDCRQNLAYVNDGADMVYHAAGAGIVQHRATGKQSFYLKHTDDIICLAVNRKQKNVVATGQIGSKAAVHIWDAISKSTLAIIKGYHEKAVVSLNFSCSGKLLVSADINGNVAVWRWQEASKICSAEASSNRIFHTEFRPDSDSHFVTVGVNHIKFWTIAGGQLMSKRGVVDALSNGDVAKMQTMLSVAFGANNVTFTGAMSGDVYVWKDNTLAKIVRKAHTGPVFSLYTTLSDGLIVSGGKERQTKDGGAIKLWDQEMKRCKPFQINSKDDVTTVKGVFREKGRILLGTKDGSIVEVAEKTGGSEWLVSGHGEGELWGLAVHPSTDQFVTASDDGTVRFWDAASKTLTHKLNVGAGRSACFSGDGDYLAVGLKNGEFILMKAASLKLVAKKRDRNQAVNDIRFSPDNRYLAVGSEASCVDFYDVSQGPPLNRIGCCKGIPSFVIQMDFSADSKFIRVSTGSYELQVFEVPSGNPVNDAKKIAGVTWATWTSALGPDMVGVWPKEAENADVNCACVNHGGQSVVTGDDFGLVKLLEFPCQQKLARHSTYVGHSAHVTNVRFTANDKHLISIGGDDCCIFVWSCRT